ncbi:MAG: deoxynucleoside kinase [Chitinophagales bacterium]
MEYNFIAIEGCIGTGKTSFAKMLAQDISVPLALESFEDNPYLEKFYKDPKNNAFSLELYFMAERYNQQKRIAQKFNLFNQIVVADYAFIKSQVFANITLENPDDLQLFKMLFNIINQNIKAPDIILYLHKSTDVLLENIKKRGRTYEQNISAEYLDTLHQAYIQYLKQQSKSKVIMVDTTDLDFVKNKCDFYYLKDVLSKKYTEKFNFI